MPVSEAQDDLLFPDELASLLSAGAETLSVVEPPDERTNASLSALPDDLSFARPYAFEAFDDPSPDPAGAEPKELLPTHRELQIELGRAELSDGERQSLRDGSIVTLDRRADDPVDIVLEGRLIARGEVLVLNDRLCIRVSEVLGTRGARKP